MSRLEGFDNFRRQLARLARNAERLHGKHAVPLSELFPDAFMRRHSRFETVQEMFDASPYKVESQSDLDAIPDDEWDRYIRANTAFQSWAEMIETGGAAYVKRQLMS